MVDRSDALRLNPNSPDVLALRGLVLFLTGKLPQALQHVSSALRLDPGHVQAQKLRKRVKDVERLKEEGNVAFKLGKLQEAYDLYSETLDVGDFCVFRLLKLTPPSSASAHWRRKAKVARFALRCCQTVLQHF
jgi:tetratricopeptide (TPR) repeat protein